MQEDNHVIFSRQGAKKNKIFQPFGDLFTLVCRDKAAIFQKKYAIRVSCFNPLKSKKGTGISEFFNINPFLLV